MLFYIYIIWRIMIKYDINNSTEPDEKFSV